MLSCDKAVTREYLFTGFEFGVHTPAPPRRMSIVDKAAIVIEKDRGGTFLSYELWGRHCNPDGSLSTRTRKPRVKLLQRNFALQAAMLVDFLASQCGETTDTELWTLCRERVHSETEIEVGCRTAKLGDEDLALKLVSEEVEAIDIQLRAMHEEAAVA